MANRRIIVKRRKTVRNIRKITRTMQLIATARFQAAFNRATASKPYTEKLADLVASLSGAVEQVDHPLMRTDSDAKRSALVVMSSNRGFCGGFNANVLRVATNHLASQESQGMEPDVYMLGKKGISYFRFLGRSMVEQITNLGDKPQFEDVEPIVQGLMNRFVAGEVASVDVAYMKFHSAGRQEAVVSPLLPLASESIHKKGDLDQRKQVEFEFSPDPAALLDELLPATVRVRFYQSVCDAIVSEHLARMVAMKAATDAAGDMIKSLTRQYNRARQTQITMELLDIVSGANAIS